MLATRCQSREAEGGEGHPVFAAQLEGQGQAGRVGHLGGNRR